MSKNSKAKNNKTSNTINHLLLISGLFYKNELIEINCCGYDIQKKQISAETAIYIQPQFFTNIKELMEESQIEETKAQNIKYITLDEAMNKLNRIIKDNYISKSNNFGIIYVNNDLINILYEKLELKNLISFNLFELFNDYYHKKFETLNKILSELNLKQNNNAPPCPKELKTMARIINKMVKEGKTFYVPETIPENKQSKVSNGKNNKSNNSINNINNKENKSSDNYINFHIELKNENNAQTGTSAYQTEETILDPDVQCYYIRIKNFPVYINKIDIKDLLYQFEINDNDIVLSYNIFGKKTGDAIIRLFNLEQYKEIFTSYNFYYFNDKYILELFDSNSQEFSICSRSIQYCTQKIRNKHLNIFIKISKIPQNSNENDLKLLFNNCSIVEYGIKFNRNSSHGEAVIVFETEEECFEALQKNNGRLLKNQSIALKESNLNEFEEFAASMAFEYWLPILSELITPDDVKRSLYLMGLPLDTNKNQVLKYLSQFNVNHSNLVVSEKILSNYGSIIVKFYNEDIANEAKNWIKNNKFDDKVIYVENLLSVVNKGNTMT